MNNEQHQRCLYCLNRPEFKLNIDLIQHLKQKHCLIDNNNFHTCLYGLNSRCSINNSVKQTQKDYDEHVLKDHLLIMSTSKQQQQQTRSSTGSGYESFKPIDNSSGDHSSTEPIFSSASVKFSSNLSAVLNDPRKERNKINQIFTKTWGADFTDNPSFPEFTVREFQSVNAIDFKNYLAAVAARHKLHIQNSQSLKNSLAVQPKVETQADIDQIPKIFFDQKFTLEDKETFNTVFNWKFFETNKKDSSSSLSQLSASLTPQQQKQSRKLLQEKLSHYLDLIELQISKQISQKANTFFHAMGAQDEVQEHVLKTCAAVKTLRNNIKELDQNVVLKSIKVLQLIKARAKYKKLLEKLERVSSVHQTQRTIQLQLSTSEFSGSLDLISLSQEILQQNLSGIHCMRHFSSQLSEIGKFIDKMLHSEFSKYVENDLSRAFVDGESVYDKEKLTSLLFAILHIQNSTFIDLFKEDIIIYIKSAIKQTVIEYVAQLDDKIIDENNVSLMDRVRQLSFQEFLHLLARVLSNVKTMLGRVKSITNVTFKVIDSASGRDASGVYIVNTNSQKELLGENEYVKTSNGLKELLISSCDYAQERLVKLLDGKTKDSSFEKLSANDFVSLSNILEEFIIEYDAVADKRTSTLRSWVQNQGNKFLIKFHAERKERITLVLDNERWKAYEVPVEIQYLVNHISANGLSLPLKKIETSSNQKLNEFLLINNEKYVVAATVLVLVKIMAEYCQFSIDMPSLSFDVMTRLIEILKIFNSRTCQLILGAGALQVAGLKTITIKHLGLAYRCLELVLHYLPMVKEYFQNKISDKLQSASSLRQFDQLIKDYTDHKNELNLKLLSIVDDVFKEHLERLEVKAPVPSQCFRQICTQICKVHELLADIFTSENLVQLFTKINEMFKMRLSKRLKELNVVNDAGPQHALIFSDMSYYIKQFKNLNGLHLIQLNLEDVWSLNSNAVTTNTSNGHHTKNVTSVT